MQTIWRWRHIADEATTAWTEPQAVAYHDAVISAALVDVRWRRQQHSSAMPFTTAAIRALAGGVQPHILGPIHHIGEQYVLFFDGGSRGNPGPGGSGSVVVRVPHSAMASAIVWPAAMSYSSTTNNQAEYVGLVTGLKAAKGNGWVPLTVVGDSQLILNQMQHYKAPLHPRLKAPYADARRIADALRVIE